MKIIQFILLASITITLHSCYKPGKIQVQNNISQVKIMDIKWGDVYITSELLPGESTSKMKVEKNEKKLPSTHNISFVMTSNNKSIYLQTEEEYFLDQDGDLLIVLSDDTPVKNTNE